jgi:hypothetical protein
MTEAQRSLPSPWEETDVARVVRVLRRAGPLRLPELADEPDLDAWPPQRVEHAIVGAWSRNLIFIDNRDLLVAI